MHHRSRQQFQLQSPSNPLFAERNSRTVHAGQSIPSLDLDEPQLRPLQWKDPEAGQQLICMHTCQSALLTVTGTAFAFHLHQYVATPTFESHGKHSQPYACAIQVAVGAAPCRTVTLYSTITQACSFTLLFVVMLHQPQSVDGNLCAALVTP